MRYRSHIEFLSYEKVKVTNAYRQKIFDLHDLAKKDAMVDLTSLKEVKNSDFYFIMGGGKGTLSSPYSLSVYAKVDAVGNEQDITRGPDYDRPEFNIKNFREQTFEVSIPE